VSAWPPPPMEEAPKLAGLPGLPADEQGLSRLDEKARKLDRHPYFF
jgi:hypothetical protein